ncbi:MAG TPA: ferrous iron transport protein B [Clostridia bacterium]|nr:ferrous iron transport protein B [Clostridia bacterium]
MGLTSSSTGANCIDNGFEIKKTTENDSVIALAGNPNVGKSTVFNNLTGLKQHTGNWPGKTVTSAMGIHTANEKNYILVDLPGTYSLLAHSAEEEVARDFICFGSSDAVITVCDSTCLERNINLVLQTIEITDNVIVCLNLMDEAKKKGIEIDIDLLSKRLGVPVVPTNARKGEGLRELIEETEKIVKNSNESKTARIKYITPIEQAVDLLEPVIKKIVKSDIKARWIAIRLLEGNESINETMKNHFGIDFMENEKIKENMKEIDQIFEMFGLTRERLRDKLATGVVDEAEKICKDVVTFKKGDSRSFDRKLDKLFTGRLTGIPIMLALLMGVLWLTITGANYPSELIMTGLMKIQEYLLMFFNYLNAPEWLSGALIMGSYRVMAWVVAVMLPPMAIFFPLFTLLEDIGYLPRIAFNLDHSFKKCGTCGKQALTMCMGLGCNAAGVIGARIIDSPRERLIAIITNAFIPCNGRLPQPMLWQIWA